jgi:hypothetical protein
MNLADIFNVVTDNPFTKEFYEEELQKVTFPPSNNGRVTIDYIIPTGRLDGYMYKDFVVGYPKAPVFKIDGRVWMSITPMEVESHYMPIKLSYGRVGVGGLGLGYYTQRVLDLDKVEEVVVYELDKEVIDTYKQNFGDHPKLTIHNQSALDVQNEEFDFFYMDIYETGGDMDALDHMYQLKMNNIIDTYHFWTMEMFIFAMINEGYTDLPWEWRKIYFPFIEKLLSTKQGMVVNYLDGEEVFDQLDEMGYFTEF